MANILIADSGATKCEWVLLYQGKKKRVITQGISPYFLDGPQIQALLSKELLPKIKNIQVDEVYYYGTGLSNPDNAKLIKSTLKKVLPAARVNVNHDLLGAAKALCGNTKGIACILGTGSNSCYFDGKKIVKNSPGLGYVLGDEGSGAYLGKKVIQHYLYNTFDDDLRSRFDAKFVTTPVEILEHVYRQPLPNRYLAGFAIFLAENRGHYMVENIIEDGLNDFFVTHIYKYAQSWTHPIHFTGSIAFGFKDILLEVCNSYELELGNVFRTPMEGLIKYHQS